MRKLPKGELSGCWLCRWASNRDATELHRGLLHLFSALNRKKKRILSQQNTFQ